MNPDLHEYMRLFESTMRDGGPTHISYPRGHGKSTLRALYAKYLGMDKVEEKKVEEHFEDDLFNV
jgi:hypothetical protein